MAPTRSRIALILLPPILAVVEIVDAFGAVRRTPPSAPSRLASSASSSFAGSIGGRGGARGGGSSGTGTIDGGGVTGLRASVGYGDDSSDNYVVEGRKKLVESWLLTHLPTLPPSDLQSYAARLYDDGFTSLERLNAINTPTQRHPGGGRMEDLYFMKKGHRRVLMKKLGIIRNSGMMRGKRTEDSDQNRMAPMYASAVTEVGGGSEMSTVENFQSRASPTTGVADEDGDSFPSKEEGSNDARENNPLSLEDWTARQDRQREQRLRRQRGEGEDDEVDATIEEWLSEQNRLVEERRAARLAEEQRLLREQETERQLNRQEDTEKDERGYCEEEVLVDDFVSRYQSLEIKTDDHGTADKEARRLFELKRAFLERMRESAAVIGGDKAEDFVPDDFEAWYLSLDEIAASGWDDKQARRVEELKRACLEKVKSSSADEAEDFVLDDFEARYQSLDDIAASGRDDKEARRVDELKRAFLQRVRSDSDNEAEDFVLDDLKARYQSLEDIAAPREDDKEARRLRELKNEFLKRTQKAEDLKSKPQSNYQAAAIVESSDESSSNEEGDCMMDDFKARYQSLDASRGDSVGTRGKEERRLYELKRAMLKRMQAAEELNKQRDEEECIMDDFEARYRPLDIASRYDDGARGKEARRLEELKRQVLLKNTRKKLANERRRGEEREEDEKFTSKYDSVGDVTASKDGISKKEARRLEGLKRQAPIAHTKSIDEEPLRLDLLERRTKDGVETAVERKERMRVDEFKRLAKLSAEKNKRNQSSHEGNANEGANVIPSDDIISGAASGDGKTYKTNEARRLEDLERYFNKRRANRIAVVERLELMSADAKSKAPLLLKKEDKKGLKFNRHSPDKGCSSVEKGNGDGIDLDDLLEEMPAATARSLSTTIAPTNNAGGKSREGGDSGNEAPVAESDLDTYLDITKEDQLSLSTTMPLSNRQAAAKGILRLASNIREGEKVKRGNKSKIDSGDHATEGEGPENEYSGEECWDITHSAFAERETRSLSTTLPPTNLANNTAISKDADERGRTETAFDGTADQMKTELDKTEAWIAEQNRLVKERLAARSAEEEAARARAENDTKTGVGLRQRRAELDETEAWLAEQNRIVEQRFALMLTMEKQTARTSQEKKASSPAGKAKESEMGGVTKAGSEQEGFAGGEGWDITHSAFAKRETQSLSTTLTPANSNKNPGSGANWRRSSSQEAVERASQEDDEYRGFTTRDLFPNRRGKMSFHSLATPPLAAMRARSLGNNAASTAVNFDKQKRHNNDSSSSSSMSPQSARTSEKNDGRKISSALDSEGNIKSIGEYNKTQSGGGRTATRSITTSPPLFPSAASALYGKIRSSPSKESKMKASAGNDDNDDISKTKKEEYYDISQSSFTESHQSSPFKESEKSEMNDRKPFRTTRTFPEDRPSLSTGTGTGKQRGTAADSFEESRKRAAEARRNRESFIATVNPGPKKLKPPSAGSQNEEGRRNIAQNFSPNRASLLGHLPRRKINYATHKSNEKNYLDTSKFASDLAPPSPVTAATTNALWREGDSSETMGERYLDTPRAFVKNLDMVPSTPLATNAKAVTTGVNKKGATAVGQHQFLDTPRPFQSNVDMVSSNTSGAKFKKSSEIPPEEKNIKDYYDMTTAPMPSIDDEAMTKLSRKSEALPAEESSKVRQVVKSTPAGGGGQSLFGINSLAEPSDDNDASNGQLEETYDEDVMCWLLAHLPQLEEEDAVAYFNCFLEYGFDSIDMLSEVLEEDLYFMKRGHRRALLKSMNSTKDETTALDDEIYQVSIEYDIEAGDNPKMASSEKKMDNTTDQARVELNKTEAWIADQNRLVKERLAGRADGSVDNDTETDDQIIYSGNIAELDETEAWLLEQNRRVKERLASRLAAEEEATRAAQEKKE